MSANDTARTPEPFVYRLKAVAKVVDGDTVDLDLDLGFSITLRQRVRLYGIDAPEVHTKDPIEKAKGLESAYLFVVGHSFLAERILTLQESKQASCRF
jgi:micrococcal nuclease